jgi:hypothetical protein
MEIGERLRLSEFSEWLACFREGMFIRFYDAHLGWFCQQGKPLKVLRRSFKKLEDRVVLYGGLPQASFDAWLLTQHPALAVQEQPWRLQLHLPVLQAWCAAQPIATTQLSLSVAVCAESGQRQVLTELSQVGLASCTPLQALQWLARWLSLVMISAQSESSGEG